MKIGVLIFLLLIPVDLHAQITSMVRKGRWIEINDRYPYIVGIDLQRLASWTDIDPVKTLNEIQKSKINFIRIWIEPVFMNPEDSGKKHIFPYPYQDGHFEFNRWNHDYWKRLRMIVQDAQQRDIVVCLSIFNVQIAQFDTFRSPFDKNQNNGSFFSAGDDGDLHPEWYDLKYSENGIRLSSHQKRLLDKTILETGSYPNVIYEIQNENGFHSLSVSQANSWQNHWARYAKKNTPRLIKVHAHYKSASHIKGVEDYVDQDFIDILNFHFYSGKPDKISALLNSIQGKGKILFDNEGFSTRKADGSLDEAGLDNAMRNNWGLLTSGGYGAVFNLSRHDDKIGDQVWQKIARRLRVQREIAESVPFHQMSAVDDTLNEYDDLVIKGPSHQWQVFAKIGKHYLIYFWGKKNPRKTRIQLPGGHYKYHFQDVRNGRVLLSGSCNSSGRSAWFDSPPGSSWDREAGLSLIIQNSSE